MIDTSEVGAPEPSRSFKKFVPVLTLVCCIASVVLFIGINLEDNSDSWDVYRKWGAPSATDIFNGKYWGLFTSNFLHIELWHIVFNLYWLWFFGKKIEFESGKLFYALLIFSSGLVSSLSELSFASETGIGLSGIGYALFGFVFVKSKTTAAYQQYLSKSKIISFIVWLFLCVVLTKIKAVNIGNAAHFGGLLWGVLLGYISKFRVYRQWMIGSVLFLIVASSIFWSPVSTSWLSYRAYKLHENQQADEAMIYYKKVLDGDPDNSFAKDNIRLLDIHVLQEKAYRLHSASKYQEAAQVYREILTIDPGNQWASENMKKLPTE